MRPFWEGYEVCHSFKQVLISETVMVIGLCVMAFIRKGIKTSAFFADGLDPVHGEWLVGIIFCSCEMACKVDWFSFLFGDLSFQIRHIFHYYGERTHFHFNRIFLNRNREWLNYWSEYNTKQITCIEYMCIFIRCYMSWFPHTGSFRKCEFVEMEMWTHSLI